VSTPRRNGRPPRLPGLEAHPLTDQPSNQILDHSVQNHPKPDSFLSSGVSSGSSLTPLNPTIDHTYICIYICIYINIYTVDTSGVNRLVSQISHNRLFCKKLQHNLLRMILTEVSSLATHNTGAARSSCGVSCNARHTGQLLSRARGQRADSSGKAYEERV
jgi:hypothetical protein